MAVGEVTGKLQCMGSGGTCGSIHNIKANEIECSCPDGDDQCKSGVASHTCSGMKNLEVATKLTCSQGAGGGFVCPALHNVSAAAIDCLGYITCKVARDMRTTGKLLCRDSACLCISNVQANEMDCLGRSCWGESCRSANIQVTGKLTCEGPSACSRIQNVSAHEAVCKSDHACSGGKNFEITTKLTCESTSSKGVCKSFEDRMVADEVECTGPYACQGAYGFEVTTRLSCLNGGCKQLSAPQPISLTRATMLVIACSKDAHCDSTGLKLPELLKNMETETSFLAIKFEGGGIVWPQENCAGASASSWYCVHGGENGRCPTDASECIGALKSRPLRDATETHIPSKVSTVPVSVKTCSKERKYPCTVFGAMAEVQIPIPVIADYRGGYQGLSLYLAGGVRRFAGVLTDTDPATASLFTLPEVFTPNYNSVFAAPVVVQGIDGSLSLQSAVVNVLAAQRGITIRGPADMPTTAMISLSHVQCVPLEVQTATDLVLEEDWAVTSGLRAHSHQLSMGSDTTLCVLSGSVSTVWGKGGGNTKAYLFCSY